ncbi:MAG: thioredoxin family protein [candidate division Zixibacteria bacterium]
MSKLLKTTYLFLPILILILLAGFVFADPSAKKEKSTKSPEKRAIAEDKINWVSYPEGLKLAKESGKKIFLEFTAVWCGWCKRMRATTFKDPEIIKTLNENYISISLDGESRDTINVDGWFTSGRKLAGELGVRSFPYFWFLKSDGERLAPLRGYQTAENLINILLYLKDDTYETMDFKQFLAEREQEKKNEKP